MTATCVNLLNPIDAQTSDLLGRLRGAAAELGIDLLLVGAFAREVLCSQIEGLEWNPIVPSVVQFGKSSIEFGKSRLRGFS